jgi:hypothetical protein
MSDIRNWGALRRWRYNFSTRHLGAPMIEVLPPTGPRHPLMTYGHKWIFATEALRVAGIRSRCDCGANHYVDDTHDPEALMSCPYAEES